MTAASTLFQELAHGLMTKHKTDEKTNKITLPRGLVHYKGDTRGVYMTTTLMNHEPIIYDDHAGRHGNGELTACIYMEYRYVFFLFLFFSSFFLIFSCLVALAEAAVSWRSRFNSPANP